LGTLGGGCVAESDKWVKPDDTIELKIESIGILKNEIIRNLK
jgi:2-keto-4-pentenoate hydratase/2-oxohepta-3-ene-1,7-dioic acid hydratase in catechol pathway